jgi:ribosome-binding factor A
MGERPRKRDDRKTLQLCRQVQRALSFAISETGDDRLLSTYVQDVEPHPDAGHMMVSVTTGEDPAETLGALHEHTGKLRTEVAHAITRRKAPELFFQVLPNG